MDDDREIYILIILSFIMMIKYYILYSKKFYRIYFMYGIVGERVLFYPETTRYPVIENPTRTRTRRFWNYPDSTRTRYFNTRGYPELFNPQKKYLINKIWPLLRKKQKFSKNYLMKMLKLSSSFFKKIFFIKISKFFKILANKNAIKILRRVIFGIFLMILLPGNYPETTRTRLWK